MKKKTICFFTGARSEYGLLRPLIIALRQRSGFRVQLIVSGSHLSSFHGRTVEEISQDGLCPDAEIEVQLSSDSPQGTCKSMGLGLISYGETLARLKPDLLVVLGDRFETFSMVAAASVCSLPIAHLHGGEVTTGAVDDAFRHAITKMSHLHFVSTEVSRRRVLQLGESPDRVWNVGAIGLAAIQNFEPVDKTALEKELSFSFGQRSVLVTFHPVTREPGEAKKQITALLAALGEDPELRILFTGVNADASGQVIAEAIKTFVARQPHRTKYVLSLGQRRYFAAVRCVDAVVGNSSSGIIEVPSLGVPVINIGERQRGRVQADSIINCPPKTSAIRQALERALSEERREVARVTVNPYAQEGTVEKIVRCLEQCGEISLKKVFYDLKGKGQCEK